MTDHATGLSRLGSTIRSVQARRSRVRAVAEIAATALLIVALTGGVSRILFAQQSAGKWIASVALAAAPILLLRSRSPLTAMGMASVAALPFAQLAVTIGGQAVQLLPVVLALSVVVAAATTVHPAGAPYGSAAIPILGSTVVALTAIPAALGSEFGGWLARIVTVAAFGYVMARAAQADRRAPLALSATLVLSVAVQGLLAINQYRTGFVFNPYGSGQQAYQADYFYNYEGGFRSSGSFPDPLALGNVLAVVLPLAVALYLMATQLSVRILSLVSAVFISAGLVLTFSRQSWIAAVVAVVVVFLLAPQGRRLGRIVVLSGAIGLSVAAVAALTGSAFRTRLESILDPTAVGVGTAQSDLVREQLWATAFRLFLEHPLFGIGFGNISNELIGEVADSTSFSHAHNTYLQALAEGGLLAGIGLVMVILVWFSTAIQRIRTSDQGDWVAVSAISALGAVLVVWLTDVTASYETVMLVMSYPLLMLHATRPRIEKRLHLKGT